FSRLAVASDEATAGRRAAQPALSLEGPQDPGALLGCPFRPLRRPALFDSD
ncbi:unnamed protein product, partial [Mesorhabditis spiculigera]